MTVRSRRTTLQARADLQAKRSSDSTRHKCFVSYHVADMDEVELFIDDYGSTFIARCVGVTEESDFVDSTDEEYIKRRIREDYLTDSTVTIVLLGKCTWSRKFVDWEISSSFRNDSNNKRSGLLVIPLPSMKNSARLPDRIKDNWVENDTTNSYALYNSYPTSSQQLKRSIKAVFDSRTTKGDKVDNSRSLRKRNSSC
ncbi:TIR domain-containing protein [Candidatus Poriferisocius sp.]|uniref:TIR domain-containing protein n=1 Tax=Candidatus Poriferisocius sp. TaxID=3101276 RepID=UPI003B022469